MEGDLWDLITAYNNIGIIEFSRGAFQVAAEYFEKSVRIDEKVGAVEYVLARENLAEAFEMLGRWGDALAQYNRCPGAREFRRRTGLGLFGLHPAGAADEQEGRHRQGHVVCAQALRPPSGPATKTKSPRPRTSWPISRTSGRTTPRPSDTWLDACPSSTDQTTQGLARAHTAAASIAFTQQRIDEATMHAEAGARFAGQLDDRFTMAKNDWVWGKILSSQGNREEANAKFDSAKATFEELQTPYELARLMFDVGLLKDERKKRRRPCATGFRALEATHDLERAAARSSASSRRARLRTVGWSASTRW